MVWFKRKFCRGQDQHAFDINKTILLTWGSLYWQHIVFHKIDQNWMSNQIYSQSWTVESWHIMSLMGCRKFRVFYLPGNVAISWLRHAPSVFLYTFDWKQGVGNYSLLVPKKQENNKSHSIFNCSCSRNCKGIRFLRRHKND